MTKTVLLLQNFVLSEMSHESEHAESEFYYPGELSHAELLQPPTHTESIYIYFWFYFRYILLFVFTVRLCCLTNAWLMFIYNVIISIYLNFYLLNYNGA